MSKFLTQAMMDVLAKYRQAHSNHMTAYVSHQELWDQIEAGKVDQSFSDASLEFVQEQSEAHKQLEQQVLEAFKPVFQEAKLNTDFSKLLNRYTALSYLSRF